MSSFPSHSNSPSKWLHLVCPQTAFLIESKENDDESTDFLRHHGNDPGKPTVVPNESINGIRGQVTYYVSKFTEQSH